MKPKTTRRGVIKFVRKSKFSGSPAQKKIGCKMGKQHKRGLLKAAMKGHGKFAKRAKRPISRAKPFERKPVG